jgi:hypothetical protein
MKILVTAMAIALLAAPLAQAHSWSYRSYYGGGHHTSSHGGHYSCAHSGSSHKAATIATPAPAITTATIAEGGRRR